jgi:anti-sigma factor RsiW
MNCEQKTKTGTYVDGEMDTAAQQAFAGHLETCSECSAAVVEQQELKKAVRVAGKKFTAPPELYAAARKQMAASKGGARSWWKPALIAACLLLIAALGLAWYSGARGSERTVAQLVDQHITMLASANPVDVISSDKHVVKPWYQGKLAFTFNPPELTPDSPFKLLGGRLVYVQRAPGAELVYQVRQHKISVFIFQERDVHGTGSSADLAFTAIGWQQGGLQYYAITDATKDDVEKLRSLFEEANRS